jgi:cell wall-associated NlpC family hydrolase
MRQKGVMDWRKGFGVGLLFGGLVTGGAAQAQPRAARGPAEAPLTERFVSSARELLGVPYLLGGRMRRPGEGIDCQGVLFYAAERVGRCGWKSFSVLPSVSVPAGELGAAVEGLSPVASSALDVSRLLPGDVLLLVGFAPNPAEPAIGELQGRPVWVWHTGLYSGGGKWIVGDHFAGKVVEEDLQAYLAAHADMYSGLVVTRMTAGPRPGRCRTHPPMPKPGTGRAPAPAGSGR